MRKIVIVFIRAYQYLLSPFMAPSCRYTPTCSEYAIESLQRFGFVRGLILAVRRIFSCHPWHHGGYDPVPAVFSLRPGTCDCHPPAAAEQNSPSHDQTGNHH